MLPIKKREELVDKLEKWNRNGEIKNIVIDHKLYWKSYIPIIEGLRPLKNGRLALAFWNEKIGLEEVRVFDVWKYFKSRRNDPLISPWFNPEYFKRVYLYHQMACWEPIRELSAEQLYENSEIVRGSFEDLDWSKVPPTDICPRFTGMRPLKNGRLALEYVHWNVGGTEVKVADIWKYYESNKDEPAYKRLYNPRFFNKAYFRDFRITWPGYYFEISVDELYKIGKTVTGYFTDQK